jgi:hypothetical protein
MQSRMKIIANAEKITGISQKIISKRRLLLGLLYAQFKFQCFSKQTQFTNVKHNLGPKMNIAFVSMHLFRTSESISCLTNAFK